MEHRGEESRVALLRTAGGHSYITPPEMNVEHAVWSPAGDRLLVQTDEALAFIDPSSGKTQPVEGVAAVDEPRTSWFSPDGRRVAVPGASILAIVGAGPAAVQVALDPGEETVGVLWTSDGAGIVLLRVGGAAPKLVMIDSRSAKVVSRVEVACDRLLGWRKGQLLGSGAGGRHAVYQRRLSSPTLTRRRYRDLS